MEIEYDIEKEIRKLKKKSDKILVEYSNFKGLDEVLNETLSLIDSKSFNTLTKNIVNYSKDFNERNALDELNIDSIIAGNTESVGEEFYMLKHSTILRDSKINFHLPGLWDDTITFGHFFNFISFNAGILTMKEGRVTTYSKSLILTNKLMISLYNFDNDMYNNIIDEEFFKKLKNIKWNKKPKKLFEKILSIQLDIVDLIIATLFSDILRDIFSNYRFTLETLVACSAVNNDRTKMEYEDVICAFRTFYKLIDADIDDLI